jgi:hypothetical protein
MEAAFGDGEADRFGEGVWHNFVFRNDGSFLMTYTYMRRGRDPKECSGGISLEARGEYTQSTDGERFACTVMQSCCFAMHDYMRSDVSSDINELFKEGKTFKAEIDDEGKICLMTPHHLPPLPRLPEIPGDLGRSR